MTDLDAKRREPSRAETVALLALLRVVPPGVTWSDIAQEAQFAGSAVAVLDKIREENGALFPDPALDQAIAEADRDLKQWEQARLGLVTVLSGRFPSRLASVFDCPPFLFTRGKLIPDDPGMSVVGSRKATPEGLKTARCAAQLLVQRNLTVIAGLAEGIDTEAHREALTLGARTVAVIGTGIRRNYPASNQDLQEEIARKGLVISQFYPDQPPTKATFPMRNGTMSGYGLATIVVEASEYSGSRVQARKAADHGRRVILTKQVASSTSWGAVMAAEPGVAVVGSRQELADAIDQIVADSSDDFMKALGLATA
jgi:DNA processing protein